MTEFQYRCSRCGRTYARDEVRYLCLDCGREYVPGMPLCGVLEVDFDYDRIARSFEPSRPDWDLFSPVEREYYPAYPAGNTPFAPAPRLGERLGWTDLWIKNDGLNPSGSLKDRASFLVVAEAARLNESTVVCASTGNAASSLAAVCAAAGRRAVIFVPQSAPRAKLVQMLICGARVLPVRGSYDDAFRLSLEYTRLRGGLNRNTAYHPLTIEGKKTAGLEIFAQNGLRVPDAIVVPVGDGVIISGIHKAFRDLRAAGLCDRLPRLVAVQAESSAAIHDFIVNGSFRPAASPSTIADSISVSVPSNPDLARRAVQESGGFSLTVSDERIMEAQTLLADHTGIFAEPAAAAAAAALLSDEARERLDPAWQIVLLVTGHGLKDIEAPLARLRIPEAIPADLAALPEEPAEA
ncbi:MAG: threonine synthase [Candidatus Aminicenantes bacterium]|nr:threonine synthase [Candidatus Aminicenantes bacterium]